VRSLTEQQWKKIDQLVNSPSWHAISYVPHRVMAESFLDLECYLERGYLPRAVDRYAFICLIALYTWADFVEIVPGQPPRGGENPAVFPPVIVESSDAVSTPEEVDLLIRSTLLGKTDGLTYIFLDSRDLLIALQSDLSIAFYGLRADDAELIDSLAAANGLFLKYPNKDDGTDR